MTAGDRVIYHCDMNAYFASVEELLFPQLKTVPMAVCGNPESRRGIVVAKNELAKKRGVKTAETIYQALQKCPNLVLRPARHGLYDEYCDKANAIYAQYTDLLERASIDESYLDVTGSLHMFGGDAEALAHEIRRRIHSELGLTISVGVSFNKFFAKMGSEYKKPDAVTLITRENYRHVLWPLPIGQMHMVGRASEAALRDMGVTTIGELANIDEAALRYKLGKFGEQLRAHANGLDDAKVASIDAVEEAKSIGNGITFKRDLLSRADIVTAISALSDTVASRLRRHDLQCAAVQLTIKDTGLNVITRQKPLAAPSALAADLASCCMELIDAKWPAGKPIRLLTVTAIRLVEARRAARQLSLFDPPQAQKDRDRRESLARAVDAIREKYGHESILPASVARNDLGINDHFGELEGDDPSPKSHPK